MEAEGIERCVYERALTLLGKGLCEARARYHAVVCDIKSGKEGRYTSQTVVSCGQPGSGCHTAIMSG